MSLLKILFYYPLLNILMFFIWLVPGHNAAWGIILLTIVVRIILLIPSQRATAAQRQINQLAPLLEELKEQHGEDKQALAAAQMKLYKDNNINPFSSCLLSLVQLPILWILYSVIRSGLDVANPNLYSWLPRPDHINTIFLGFNLLHVDKTFILPILATVLQFVQTFMMLPPKSTKQGPEAGMANMQRNMLYFLPLFTLYIAMKLPAGTVLYWVIATLFTIGQQMVVIRKNVKIKGIETVERMTHETGKAFEKDLLALEDGIADSKKDRSMSSSSVVASSSVDTSANSNNAFEVKKREIQKENKKGGVTVTVRKRTK